MMRPLAHMALAVADDFGQYRKSVPKLAKALIKAADQLESAVEDAGTIKKIASRARSALKESKKSFESLAEPSPFGNIRPGIINAIEIWRNKHWEPQYALARSALVEIESLIKQMSKDPAKLDSYRVRIVQAARSLRQCGEAAFKFLPKMDDVETVPKVFKLGPFTVIDEYGVPESMAGAWFDAIRYTVKLLKQKGLDYLCYGKLELTLGVGMGGAWSGLYRVADDQISLSLSRQQTVVMQSRWRELVNTFVHELGHRCWFKFMDPGQRDRFSAPWIDQEVVVREMREKIWKVWEIPVKEREQAFKVAWDSNFDTAVFRKWLKQDPLRGMRWMRWLEFVYPRGTDYIHGPLAQKGKLFGKSWSELRSYIKYMKKRQGESDKPIHYDGVLDKFHRKNYQEWTEPKEGYERFFSENALKWAYEPDTGGMAKHPIADDIQKSLKLAKIAPSVTDYGNTNRCEDFAESFSGVVTGKEKNRQIQMRVQQALPRGRVAARTEVQGFDRRLTTKTVDKLRNDFLVLMKNIKRLRDYKTLMVWRDAVLKWRKDLEDYISLVSREIQRYPRDQISDQQGKRWENDIRAGAWALLHPMFSTFVDPYGLVVKYNDRLAAMPKEQAEQELFEGFQRKIKSWEGAVRRGSRKAWKQLRDVLEEIERHLEGGIEVPVNEVLKIQGFHVTIVGFSSRGYNHLGAIELFKAGLKLYSERARKVYPWLLRYRIPIRLDFSCGLDKGGEYDRGTLTVCAPYGVKARRVAHVIAHEMGHHIYKVLSKRQIEFWVASIKGSRGPLDLRAAMKASNEEFIGLDGDLASRDPVLALRIRTLMDDPSYSGWDMATKRGIEKFIADTGKTVVQVTVDPITGYAGKNPEESFCEALGLAVAYGPRTLLPIVQERLKLMLPQIRIVSGHTEVAAFLRARGHGALASLMGSDQ